MKTDMKKFYTTKYALSSGIKEVEGEVSERMLMIKSEWGTDYHHGEGKDWHRTRVGAIARAEAMREAKRVSLKKQMDRLDKLKFE